MKVKLTESDIKRIVAEGTKRVLYEIRLGRSVDRAINESLMELGFDDMNEDDGEDSKSVGRYDGDADKKRQKVIQALQSPQADLAQYAYQLWPDKDEDSSRSYFYKCLNGEKDDNGKEYRFTPNDVNKLYSMISNSPL